MSHLVSLHLIRSKNMKTQTQTQTSQESPIALKSDVNTNIDHLSAVSCGLDDANKELSSCGSNSTNDESCQNSVREKAYFLWENAGCPIGDGFDFWLLAQEQIKEEQIKEEQMDQYIGRS